MTSQEVIRPGLDVGGGENREEVIEEQSELGNYLNMKSEAEGKVRDVKAKGVLDLLVNLSVGKTCSEKMLPFS